MKNGHVDMSAIGLTPAPPQDHAPCGGDDNYYRNGVFARRSLVARIDLCRWATIFFINYAIRGADYFSCF